MTKHIALFLGVIVSSLVVSGCSFFGQGSSTELKSIEQDSQQLEQEVQVDPLADPDLSDEALPTDTDLDSLETEAGTLQLEPETFQ